MTALFPRCAILVAFEITNALGITISLGENDFEMNLFSDKKQASEVHNEEWETASEGSEVIIGGSSQRNERFAKLIKILSIPAKRYIVIVFFLTFENIFITKNF